MWDAGRASARSHPLTQTTPRPGPHHPVRKPEGLSHRASSLRTVYRITPPQCKLHLTRFYPSHCHHVAPRKDRKSQSFPPVGSQHSSSAEPPPISRELTSGVGEPKCLAIVSSRFNSIGIVAPTPGLAPNEVSSWAIYLFY